MKNLIHSTFYLRTGYSEKCVGKKPWGTNDAVLRKNIKRAVLKSPPLRYILEKVARTPQENIMMPLLLLHI